MAPARRMYVVRGTGNVPSLEDLRLATRAAGVPLVEIDEGLTGGDTWIQDQYQDAMMQGPTGWRELILHMPRMRNENSNETIARNLEGVVNGHFRSHDIGLFRDLWDRVVPVRSEDGNVVRPTFRDLESWVKRARRLDYVTDVFNRYGIDAAGAAWKLSEPEDWIGVLLTLDSELARLNDALDQAGTDSSEEQRRSQLVAEKDAARQLADAARRAFRLTGPKRDAVIESDLAGQRVRLRASIARKLFARGDQMHSSENYGGNIESTPPLGQAQLGTIIFGNARDPESGSEIADPDLLRIFAKQQKQPIVEIDTSWLKVGHVDEVLAVTPSSRARNGFAILHASSGAAVELLEQARMRHLLGLPMAHPLRATAGERPSGVMSRLTMEGTAPVTRLFRGKAWLHVHPRADYTRVDPTVDAPEIYLQLCRAYGTSTDGSGWSIHRIGYVPGEGEERRYPADITTFELLWAEADRYGQSSNRAFDTYFLEPSRTVLRGAFPGVAILPVPVLFDRTYDTGRLARYEGIPKTNAVTPDMVNMQVLNGHLLVPRPYGPRMLVDDAIAAVRAAMTALDVPGNIKARVGRRLIAARRMTRAEYWVERVHPAYVLSSIGTIRASYGGMETKADVVAVFRDSFPGATAAEREHRIIDPHQIHFDAQGWLKHDFSLFDSTMAWSTCSSCGWRRSPPSWAFGSTSSIAGSITCTRVRIHCGTNVLHGTPPTALRLPNVWDAADHPFRSQTIEFGAEEVGSRTGP